MSFTEPTPYPTPYPTPSPSPSINYDQSDYFYVFMFFVFFIWLCPRLCLRFVRFRRNRVYYDIENARYNFSDRLIPMTEINTEMCCICLEDLSNGQEAISIDTCLHSYHKHCINEWLNVNPICPICRRNLLN